MAKPAGMDGHIAKLWIVICYSVSAMDIFRNSVGEIPFIFLNARLKEEILVKPHSNAISIIFF